MITWKGYREKTTTRQGREMIYSVELTEDKFKMQALGPRHEEAHRQMSYDSDKIRREDD